MRSWVCPVEDPGPLAVVDGVRRDLAQGGCDTPEVAEVRLAVVAEDEVRLVARPLRFVELVLEVLRRERRHRRATQVERRHVLACARSAFRTATRPSWRSASCSACEWPRTSSTSP